MFQDNNSIQLYLQDITQVYIQLTSNLNQEFYIQLLLELILLLGVSSDCVVKVIKPLYNIPKAGNHWFATYHIHYKEKLGMEELTYNPYLFYRSSLFGIVGMQINDILILANNNFTSKKKVKIKTAKIMMKD